MIPPAKITNPNTKNCTAASISAKKIKSCGCLPKGKGPTPLPRVKVVSPPDKPSQRKEMSNAKAKRVLLKFNQDRGIESRDYNGQDFANMLVAKKTVTVAMQAKERGFYEAKQFSGQGLR